MSATDWRALWAGGDLGRFCFVSLGILLHATNETMIATIMPGMVADIDGVELVGWSLAAYEIGSIVAGAASGRLVSYLPLRGNMAGAALIYAVGAAICALAPDMNWFVAGRLVEGFGGGGLTALAFVSVERLFEKRIWPQLFAIMSVVWGVAAFSGPLIGAFMAEYLSWRWAFGLFCAGGLVMAAATLAVLRGPGATALARGTAAPPPFPFGPLAVLAAAITCVASAGVAGTPVLGVPLVALGLAGIAAFFALDARRPRARLFPHRPLDPRTLLGDGLLMLGALSIGVTPFGIYGPLLLVTLHGISTITAGYLVAAEAVSWSVLSILVAGAKPHHERAIVAAGALMIATAMAGLTWAVPAGSVPGVLACAIVQGGGFGICWPFVTRMIVASARPDESAIASSAVPTIQRIGYAVGAAIAGIAANVAGFSHGLSAETAAGVARFLFAAFLPFGLIGLWTALRLLKRIGAASAPPAEA
jgi:MFS family permease